MKNTYPTFISSSCVKSTNQLPVKKRFLNAFLIQFLMVSKVSDNTSFTCNVFAPSMSCTGQKKKKIDQPVMIIRKLILN